MKLKAKEKILETASKLFHKQGYNATGINQIIEEADVAKSTLYQYYKSKEELAIDYLNTRHQYWFEQLLEFTRKADNNLDKLKLSFDFIIYMNNKENYRGCCFLNMLSEIQDKDITLRTEIIKHKSDLQKYFEIFATENTPDAPQFIYILFEGAMIESKLYRQDRFVEAAKKAAINLIT